MTASRWTTIYLVTFVVMAAILAALIAATPRTEDGIDWLAPMIRGGWMAWTFPVALFFYCIACLLILFTILAIRFPETPRRGILQIETTRGDRLFITLLGSAFIHLAWLFFAGPDMLWAASILCLGYAAAVFRWV
jgi:predicted small integral membrane protein